MKFTVISRTSTRLIVPVMLAFSVFLFAGGHSLPGGGFSGGLVAAAAYALFAISYGADRLRGVLATAPSHLIGVGLATALAGLLLPTLVGKALFEAAWIRLTGTPDDGMMIGSPYVFELGVYLTVAGVVAGIIQALEESSAREERG